MACKAANLSWKEHIGGASYPNQECKRSAAEESLRVDDGLRLQQENSRVSFRNERLCLQGSGDTDVYTLLDLLQVCGKQKNLRKGSRIHAVVLKRGLLSKDVYLGTALLRMYAKCGALAKAHDIFYELPAPDVAAWNALISCYAQHGLGAEALAIFEQMQDQGLSPNVVTFVCVLKACGSIGAADKSDEVLAKLYKYGLSHKNVVLGTALVDMHAKCGALTKSQLVFDELPTKDLVSWNALISGYVQQRLDLDALECFRQMQNEGLSPNGITFICILKACSNLGALEIGIEIHAEVSRQGLLEKHIFLGNTLIDMYVKCGVLSKAQEVCDALPTWDAASWNSLMGGYARHGLGNEALSCFEQMQDEGLSPNAVTYVSVLQACGSLGVLELGEEIHAKVGRQGLLERNIVLGTAMVDMYVKCGALERASKLFEELPARDVALWNTLLVGLDNQELHDEALNCFQEIKNEGLSPNIVTYLCALRACSCIGAVEKGNGVEVEVIGSGFLEEHVVLGTALVNLYAKCGILAKAQEVFDGLPVQDVISWTALMAGYAQLGEVRRVFDLFSKLMEEFIEPSPITFIVLLTACSHAGLVEEGQRFFEDMSASYSIAPTYEHLLCMVDLFSRAGQFEKTVSVIEMIPPSDRFPLWSALLGACQKWVNMELGKLAFQQAVQWDENFTAGYVCMGNIYSTVSIQEEVEKTHAFTSLFSDVEMDNGLGRTCLVH